MDILNYISWVKENKIITTISDLNSTLIPIGLKDPRRDDDYLSVGISVQALANIIGGGTGTGTVTSVGAIGGTGISITGTNPITTSGTFTITNTAPDKVVTLANGDGISASGVYPNFTITNTEPDQTVVLTDGTGISVTGTYPSFTITNTQPSSGGTVTSVGLTMPSAFNVANSPVTGSATLNVTAAGVASQYVRGDGVLASFPDISGGGGGQVYYLNGSVSQGTIGGNAFEQLSTSAITTPPGVDFTSGTVDAVAFANFITDIGKPTQEVIPSGVWIYQCYFSATSTTAEVYSTVEIYDGATFTVWATSLHEIITDGSNLHLYTFTVAVPEYTPLNPADRIAIRFYPTNLGGTNTVTLHTEDSHLGSIQTTFTTGVASIDGLTAAAQYLSVGTTGTDFNIGTSGVDTHKFNLPTASATNRGALSSTDWSAFDGKQNAITLTTTGTSGASTLVGSTLNIPNYAGLTYFTEAQNTTAPNATVYVDSLTAVSTTTNADFAIIPKGNGAITTAIPDNAITGGNKRGIYAVDLQLQRNGAARVSSGPNSIILGGYNNGSYGQYSIAGGGSSEATNNYSIALGSGCTASGVAAVAIGAGCNASGASAISIGASSTAGGNYSVALGGSNTTTGQYAIALGSNNSSSTNQSVALGYQNTSSGRASTAIGSFGSTFAVYERFTQSTYGYVIGDSQKSVFILSARTTTTGAVTMTASFSQLATPAANNQVILQNNNSIRFKGSIIARQSGSTNTSAWDIDGLIVRGANAASTTLLLGNINLVQNTPAWGTPTLSANTTLGCLTIQVTGVATTNIQWTCSVDTTEVIYA